MLLLTWGLGSCSAPRAASAGAESRVGSWIQQRRFRFSADRAVPIGFPSRYLAPGYYLDLRTDTVLADLPYFGRAYTAPLDPSGGGLRFRSTRFGFQSRPDRHGWLLLFHFSDQSLGVQQATLQVSPRGSATLELTSNDRQPITFLGHLRQLP